MKWEQPVRIGHLVIKENIKCSQRVESFRVEARVEGRWETVYDGTVIGYQRILPFSDGLATDEVRLIITDSRREPTIAFFGAYAYCGSPALWTGGRNHE